MRTTRLYFVFGALPLLGYPFVLIGALFWLASLGNLSAPSARVVTAVGLAGATQLLALVYPAVLLFCFVSARVARSRGDEIRVRQLGLAPLGMLAAIVVLGLLWGAGRSLNFLPAVHSVRDSASARNSRATTR
jgi:hypothetical protein